MHKWNLLKKTAPCILSLAVAATTFPTAVMASEFDAAVVSEADEQTGASEEFGAEEVVEDTTDVTEAASDAEEMQQRISSRMKRQMSLRLKRTQQKQSLFLKVQKILTQEMRLLYFRIPIS